MQFIWAKARVDLSPSPSRMTGAPIYAALLNRRAVFAICDQGLLDCPHHGSKRATTDAGFHPLGPGRIDLAT